MKKIITKGDIRKEQLLDAAMVLAKEVGYQHVYQKSIATKVGCANGLVHHYFGTMQQLRRAIMGAAVARQDLEILAQGIVAREAKAMVAPIELREKALKSMIGA